MVVYSTTMYDVVTEGVNKMLTVKQLPHLYESFHPGKDFPSAYFMKSLFKPPSIGELRLPEYVHLSGKMLNS